MTTPQGRGKTHYHNHSVAKCYREKDGCDVLAAQKGGSGLRAAPLNHLHSGVVTCKGSRNTGSDSRCSPCRRRLLSSPLCLAALAFDPIAAKRREHVKVWPWSVVKLTASSSMLASLTVFRKEFNNRSNSTHTKHMAQLTRKLSHVYSNGVP